MPGQAEPVQRLVDAGLVRVLAVRAADQLGVLAGGQPRVPGGRLDSGDHLRARTPASSRGAAEHPDLARVRPLQAAHAAQQGGLADAVLAGHADAGAGRHGQVDTSTRTGVEP